LESWQSATRLDSIDTFLAVELLPLADAVPRRYVIGSRRLPRRAGAVVDPAGHVAAPIEVHLLEARVG
jgi:hypothetical protein